MDKPFRTYDELIESLKDDKKLNIPDLDYARLVLSKTSYHSLITGYKEIFKDKMTNFYRPDIDYYKKVKELFAKLYSEYNLEPTECCGLNVCMERDIWNCFHDC